MKEPIQLIGIGARSCKMEMEAFSRAFAIRGFQSLKQRPSAEIRSSYPENDYIRKRTPKRGREAIAPFLKGSIEWQGEKSPLFRPCKFLHFLSRFAKTRRYASPLRRMNSKSSGALCVHVGVIVGKRKGLHTDKQYNAWTQTGQQSSCGTANLVDQNGSFTYIRRRKLIRFGGRLAVGRLVLAQVTGVRIPAPEPCKHPHARVFCVMSGNCVVWIFQTPHTSRPTPYAPRPLYSQLPPSHPLFPAL